MQNFIGYTLKRTLRMFVHNELTVASPKETPLAIEPKSTSSEKNNPVANDDVVEECIRQGNNAENRTDGDTYISGTSPAFIEYPNVDHNINNCLGGTTHCGVVNYQDNDSCTDDIASVDSMSSDIGYDTNPCRALVPYTGGVVESSDVDIETNGDGDRMTKLRKLHKRIIKYMPKKRKMHIPCENCLKDKRAVHSGCFRSTGINRTGFIVHKRVDLYPKRKRGSRRR